MPDIPLPLGFAASCAAEEFPRLLHVLAEEGVSFVELGHVGGRQVGDFSPEELQQLKRACDQAGVKILAVRSTVGLTAGPSLGDQDGLLKSLRAAKRLAAPHVTVHSYFRNVRAGVRDRFSLICEHYQRLLLGTMSERVTLGVVNLPGTTCERSLDLLRLIESVGSPRLKAVLDPANAALVGEVAYEDGFPLLASHLAYLHGRDFDPTSGVFVPLGEGACPWVRIVAHLRQNGLAVPLVLREDCVEKKDADPAFREEVLRVRLAAAKGLLLRS